MDESGFFGELRRRRVLRIAGAYVAVAWLVTEIAAFLLKQADAPGWAIQLLAIAFVVGFPITLALAWVIQVGPDGERSLDSSSGQGRSVAAAIVIGLFVTAGLAWLILPRIDDAGSGSEYQPLPNSLAVLPLTTTSGTPNERTIAETLYTVLLDGLDQSRELTQVRLRIDRRPEDLVSFGREFRVAWLLLGEVLRTSNSTQLELRLLDIVGAEVRWSQTMEWEPTRIAEIGAQISDAVLNAMGLAVIPRTSFAGTNSSEAYEAYLMGQKHWDMGNARSVAISVEYFEQAIAADPAFARGYARLAGAYLTHARLSATSQAEYEKFAQKARHAANKAIELDEDSAAAISVLARLTDHPELQAQLLERALELEPDHIPSLNRYAMLVLQPAGRQAEAAELFRRILEISPLDANNRSELGFALWELGYHEEAIAQVEKSIELQPDMMQNYHWLGFRMYFEYGRLDEAVLLHRLSFSVSPETFREAASVATAYAGLGMREEALAFLEKAVDIMGWTPVVNFQAGLTYERLGDDDVSLDYYMRFVETYADKQHPDVLEFVIEDDLRAGRYEEALQRFRDASPDSTSDDVTVNEGNVWDVFQYGHLLGKGGHTEEARLRLQRVATFMASVCSEDDSNFACRLLWQVYAHLGDRKKTLEALRFSIIDKRYFANSHYLDDESLDFLRDDLEFRELMDYVDAEMDKQRSRIRKLECAGEVPPAPGIDISAFCP